MLIRLHGCAGWSAPLLFAYGIRHFFRMTWPTWLWPFIIFSIQPMFVQLVIQCAHCKNTQTDCCIYMIATFSFYSGKNLEPEHLSHIMTKPTKWHVHQGKTQVSLGICPVWSASSLCAQWVAKDPRTAYSELWLDWVDAQADQSLRWAHMPFYWFCHDVAHITY